ncbi:hypothetical protein AB0G74_16150 [Streptomyces sp. NPDC020875]|uniref:hypothetical protein n=1 Tax=Streptomyces sp. NPDC020875 TaxID=3154898 RepID=UPI0033F51FF8
MTDSVFGFHASRVCRVRGEQLAAEDVIVQAADAFRADDENVVLDAEHLCQGALAIPAVVAAAGAMVVLGEPGAGKTSVLKQLTNGLPHVLDAWSRDSDACLWVTGGDLTEHSYQEELGSHLLSLPSEGDTAGGAGVLTVVLDQADESPLLPRLPRSLRRSLSGRDIDRVRFLMACRTADYRAALTSALTQAFGACRCVDLAPLSRAEAVALADSAGVPGEDLVVAAESAGAAVLAGVPLTLELLVLTYQADGQLPGRPEELFARGVARLAEDPDPRRLKKPLITTAHQRLTVAGRIAAWMLLSGHRTVWRGASFGAGTYDLQGDVLAGGTERTDAGLFEISPQVVEECLATALFTTPDDGRVAFRHSSVAAYLAARYLTNRKITQPQLENLFLICAPDGETTTIPAPLRETAAWLVAMNPSGGDWLASADPESIAVHSALVRSDEVRRLTVSRLLELAAQIELGDTRWQLSRWDLRHPSLAHQLADNLELAPAEGAANWQSTARIRLAIQLAQEAGTDPRLADALLKLVQNDTWHQTERRLAARAAFACDPGRAVPVFVEVLATLSDPPDAERVDPDHELRGTLLSLLWPHHLDAATMLGALRPPSPDLYGNYAHFLRTMPGECRDEDLPSLLAWASDAVCRPDSGYVFSGDRFEISLINGVIDRAMKTSEATQHAGNLAKIIFSLLHNHHKAQLPDCLQPDEHGDETQETRSRRRLLTQALVREAVRANFDPHTAAYQIVYDWERRPSLRLDAASEPESATRHQLVDREDFLWLLEQTVEAAGDGDGATTQVYGELASWTFPTDDPHVFELAYDEMHPAWPYLRSFYAAIRVDSPLAQSLRHNYSAGSVHWPEFAAFMAQQTRLLAEARAGDNDSLWQFLWGLRFDPQTGDFAKNVLGALSNWPAAVALGDDLSDLAELARRYLTTEHDRADSWLPHARRNKSSWAGYALLAELHRMNSLLEFPAGVWSSWAAAILTEYVGMSTSYMEPVRVDLLRLAARHAPESVSLRVGQVARAALTAGRQPIELNAIDPRWAPELRTCLEDLAIELSTCLGLGSEAAERTLAGSPGNADHLARLPNNDEAREAALWAWQRTLAALLTTDSRVAHEIIDASIDGPRETPLAARAAVLAVHALLTADAEAHWPRAKAFAANDPELGRRLAEACARREEERIQVSLNEALVSELYSWLSGLYDPAEDEPLRGVGWITDEQQARSWRDHLLAELSRRGTAEAIRQLRQLATLYPSRLSIAAALVEATKQYAVASWSQVRTEDVVRLLQDPALRIIRTGTDLLDVVHEVLEEVGRELPSHCELLWDRTPGKRPRRPSVENPFIPDVWRPKPEAALCAYLAHELLMRLAGRRVAVNREVLIHPTDPYGAGNRTDLLVEAMPSPGDDPNLTASGSVKLVIEVKGSWNDEVLTSQAEQLAGRYLPEAGTDVGIYIVGWYPIELWNATGDNRKTQAKKLQPDTLLVHLLDQAASLSQAGGVHVRPMVINIPRPDTQKV